MKPILTLGLVLFWSLASLAQLPETSKVYLRALRPSTHNDVNRMAIEEVSDSLITYAQDSLSFDSPECNIFLVDIVQPITRLEGDSCLRKSDSIFVNVKVGRPGLGDFELWGMIGYRRLEDHVVFLRTTVPLYFALSIYHYREFDLGETCTDISFDFANIRFTVYNGRVFFQGSEWNRRYGLDGLR